MTFETLRELLSSYKSERLENGVTIFWENFHGYPFVAGISTEDVITVMATANCNPILPDYKDARLVCMRKNNEYLPVNVMAGSVIVIPHPQNIDEHDNGFEDYKAFFTPNIYSIGNAMYMKMLNNEDTVQAIPYIGGKVAEHKWTGKHFCGFQMIDGGHYFFPVLEHHK